MWCDSTEVERALHNFGSFAEPEFESRCEQNLNFLSFTGKKFITFLYREKCLEFEANELRELLQRATSDMVYML